MLAIQRVKPSKGFTLVELLIVMALCCVLTAVVYSVWNSVQNRLAMHEVQSQAAIIVDAARAWRNSQTSYNTISKSTLCVDGVLPSNMCKGSGQQIDCPWGKIVTIEPYAQDKNNEFVIRFKGAAEYHLQELQLLLTKGAADQNGVKKDGNDVIAVYD